MKNLKKLTLAILCVLPLSGMAAQNGLAVSYGTHAFGLGDPDNVNGFNLAYTWQPDSWNWGNFSLLMNFSYGHWTTSGYTQYQSINTYGIAPVLRWYFLQSPSVTPFLQGSVGAAYLSNTYFGDRNLGSSVLFQDQLGVGLAFGQAKNFYTTLQFLHYSNAGLASSNAGFTVPIFLTAGYQF